MNDQISKPNRRRAQEPKHHSIVQGAPPPNGVHQVSRKARDRRIAQAIRQAIKR